MDQPLRAVADEIFVSFHKFTLEDADPRNIEDPPSDDWLPRDPLTVRQGIVCLRSPGHTHRAAVTAACRTTAPHRSTSARGRWCTAFASIPAATNGCGDLRAVACCRRRATRKGRGRSTSSGSGRPGPFRTTWPRRSVRSGRRGYLNRPARATSDTNWYAAISVASQIRTMPTCTVR